MTNTTKTLFTFLGIFLTIIGRQIFYGYFSIKFGGSFWVLNYVASGILTTFIVVLGVVFFQTEKSNRFARVFNTLWLSFLGSISCVIVLTFWFLVSNFTSYSEVALSFLGLEVVRIWWPADYLTTVAHEAVKSKFGLPIANVVDYKQCVALSGHDLSKTVSLALSCGYELSLHYSPLVHNIFSIFKRPDVVTWAQACQVTAGSLVLVLTFTLATLVCQKAVSSALSGIGSLLFPTNNSTTLTNSEVISPVVELPDDKSEVVVEIVDPIPLIEEEAARLAQSQKDVVGLTSLNSQVNDVVNSLPIIESRLSKVENNFIELKSLCSEISVLQNKTILTFDKQITAAHHRISNTQAALGLVEEVEETTVMGSVEPSSSSSLVTNPEPIVPLGLNTTESGAVDGIFNIVKDSLSF